MSHAWAWWALIVVVLALVAIQKAWSFHTRLEHASHFWSYITVTEDLGNPSNRSNLLVFAEAP